MSKKKMKKKPYLYPILKTYGQGRVAQGLGVLGTSVWQPNKLGLIVHLDGLKHASLIVFWDSQGILVFLDTPSPVVFSVRTHLIVFFYSSSLIVFLDRYQPYSIFEFIRFS